jgi:general secretion pathway protein A
MLEMVRLLSNLETTRFKLLQIVLCGQQTLLQKLNSRELEQMGQRVTVSVELQPLSVPETMTYIEHRLAVAGRTRRVFTAEAVNSITRLSRGVPRNINRLCYGSMGLACGKGRHTVDSELVEESFSEFRSILWVDPQEPGGSGLRPLSLPTPLRRRAYRDGRSAAPPSEEESTMSAQEPKPAAEAPVVKTAPPEENVYPQAAGAPEPSVEVVGGYGHLNSGGD